MAKVTRKGRGRIPLEDLAVVDASKSTIGQMKRKLDKMRSQDRY